MQKLDSKDFEKAVDALRHLTLKMQAHGDMGMVQLRNSMYLFSQSVNKMQRILGMQAENDYRQACGDQVAYTEEDFLDV